MLVMDTNCNGQYNFIPFIPSTGTYTRFKSSLLGNEHFTRESHQVSKLQIIKSPVGKCGFLERDWRPEVLDLGKSWCYYDERWGGGGWAWRCADMRRTNSHGKIDFKRVYTEVNFAIGPKFIMHALDDSEPIADLQGSKKRQPNMSNKCMLSHFGFINGLREQHVGVAGDYSSRPESSTVATSRDDRLTGRGGVTARALSSSTNANRARLPAKGFARGNRAGRCRWSAGFLGISLFAPPLRHIHPPPPSWSLKTLVLRELPKYPHSIPYLNPFTPHSIPYLNPFTPHSIPYLNPFTPHSIPYLNPFTPHSIPYLNPFTPALVYCFQVLRTKRTGGSIFGYSYTNQSLPRSVRRFANYLPTCKIIRHQVSQCTVQTKNYPHVRSSATIPTCKNPVAERLACSPPTKENRVQSPAGAIPDFRMWESCLTILLVSGFSRGYPVPTAPHSRAAPYSPQSPTSALNTSLVILGARADPTKWKITRQVGQFGRRNVSRWEKAREREREREDKLQAGQLVIVEQSAPCRVGRDVCSVRETYTWDNNGPMAFQTHC
ncbi:hypothetical protein PR048_030924 [Dryococelus australis]|uniref:Uncharacterized protein n=1 Tax=Dryococelus australis TaxID=614101 RepID=A0ABQ9GA88_9NEOP|nr:hypothetical protein PR048_030924 [Dryococelus australis]